MNRKAKIEKLLAGFRIQHGFGRAYSTKLVSAISRLIYNEGAEYRAKTVAATQRAIKYKNQRDALIERVSESILCPTPLSEPCPNAHDCKACWVKFVEENGERV